MMQLRYLLVVLIISFNLYGMGQSPSASITYDFPATVEAGTPFTIGMKLNRGNVTGIARIQQSWPRGFSINEVENAGSIFSFSKSQLQFLWISLPAEQEISLRFEVTASAAYSGPVEIPVIFAYLEGNQRKKQPMPALQFQVLGKGSKVFEKPVSPALSAQTALTETQKSSPEQKVSTEKKSPLTTAKTNPGIPAEKPGKPPVKKENGTSTKKEASITKSTGVKQDIVSDKTIKPISVTGIQPAAKTQVATPKATAAPSKSNVTFRIQVAALPEKTDKSLIAKDFGVDENDLQEESHNGLYKYTFGEFPSLADARKQMNSNARMKGKAFIAGYRNGIRIDLEDAIRLSKEK